MSAQAQLWEVQGRFVWQLAAGAVPGTRRERATALRQLFSNAALRISPYVFLLEPDGSEFALVKIEPGGGIELGSAATIGLEPCMFFSGLAGAYSELVLANTGQRFSVQQGMGSVRVTLHSKPLAILPSGNVMDCIDCGPKDGLQLSIVDAGEPIAIVRASSIGANGREVLGGRLRLPRVDWPAFEAELARLCGFDLAMAAVPLVWVANPPRGSDAAQEMDCSARASLDRQTVCALSGKARLSLITAAAIPGAILQQTVRALPGVDARLGLADEIMVACAEVQQNKTGVWQLHSLSMQQQVSRVLQAQLFPTTM